ncbi:thiamine-phosphate kinase [bacterium]|nr:thiamine-phosphate kinase [bacterium]
MKEFLFLNKIVTTLSNPQYLGDDCAYLEELGIVVTQDTLVEDVHFSREYTNAYKLGYKSVIVNLSDIYASGATPKYISISLSLPKDTPVEFVEDFYRAVNELALKHGFEVIGGDITGGEKISVSICALGDAKDKNISSRKNAKAGDIVIVTGEHGSSACGLYLLQNGIKNESLTTEHLTPRLSVEFASEISKTTAPYAMMDSSDGLADALFKIAETSNVTICAEFEKIPYNSQILKYTDNPQNYILFGGEDYKLVATVNPKILKTINPSSYTIIGEVVEKQDAPLKIKFKDSTLNIKDLENTFNHFEENK